MALWTTDVLAVGAILLGVGTSHLLYGAGADESVPSAPAAVETGSTVHIHSHGHSHDHRHCRASTGAWLDIRIEPMRRDLLRDEVRRGEVRVRRDEARIRAEQARLRREVARIEAEMGALVPALEPGERDARGLRSADPSIRWW